jgi:hypothetical protein
MLVELCIENSQVPGKPVYRLAEKIILITTLEVAGWWR